MDDSETSEDSDDEPLSSLVPQTATNTESSSRSNRPYRWAKKEYHPPDTSFTGPAVIPPHDQDLKSPYEYFQKFVTHDMLDNVVENTNLYSVQKSGVSTNTTRKEIEQVISMFFRMGLVRMSSVRQYWEAESSYEPVSGVMARNRFQHLLTQRHFVDNATATEDEKKDKLWKIRPWLKSMREQCLVTTPDERCSIDEMMCQYRGQTSPIWQYIKSKPHPWGFKIWERAGERNFA